MSSKIIRLESLSLMDHDENPNDGSIFQTTRIIEVGHPYDEPHFKMVWDGQHNNPVECHSDRDVVSIESIRSLCDSDGCCYLVKLKGGNELSLPIHAFIAESKEVTDDGKLISRLISKDPNNTIDFTGIKDHRNRPTQTGLEV